MIKKFRRAAMKMTIMEITNLAENEVSNHLDEILKILTELTDAELVVYKRRLGQLRDAVAKEQTLRKSLIYKR